MPQIDNDTLAELEELTITGGSVAIARHLDRPLYAKVNKVLEAAGGKWNRKAKAHVFAEDPTELLEQIVLTGEYRREKQELGVFYTPEAVAAQAVAACGDVRGQKWLEPEAGMGALAKPLRAAGAKVYCMDILERHADALDAQGFSTMCTDFLEFTLGRGLYDGVLMNPPFAKMADVKHVTHALQFVRPGGKVVAIMAAAVLWRGGAYNWIREMVRERGGSIEELPAGSFKESGTMVNTALVVIPVK